MAKRSKTTGELRGVDSRLRFTILQRDDFTCLFCGARPGSDDLHVDHIVPFSLRGSDADENLVATCSSCNLGKGARIAVPRRLCEVWEKDSDGFRTWQRWGGWALKWNESSLYLEQTEQAYPIEASRLWERVGGVTWQDHLIDKPWFHGELIAFIVAERFVKTVLRPPPLRSV